jgi:hypothetical protein
VLKLSTTAELILIISRMGTTVIDICVGAKPKQVDFCVHENLIRLSSRFFDAALIHDWKESQERIVRLPDCNVRAFRIYVQWLYTSQLHTKTHFSHASATEDQWEWANLVKAYLLGDYLQDIDFKDTIMDAMIEWGHEADRKCINAPPHSSVEIYQQTSNTSPLRKFVVDFTTRSLIDSFHVSMSDFQFPSDFLAAVVTNLAERIRPGNDVTSDFVGKKYCQYHCHGERSCYREKDKSSLPEVRKSSTSRYKPIK